jgi:hypothetical protein
MNPNLGVLWTNLRSVNDAYCSEALRVVAVFFASQLSSLTMNDLILFAATATLFTFYAKRAASEKTCDANLKNSAFVFVKPHANTPMVQKLVREKLVAAGCTILSEVDIDGKTIDEQKLIDQHYYAIGTFMRSIDSRNVHSSLTYCLCSIQSDSVVGQGYSCP